MWSQSTNAGSANRKWKRRIGLGVAAGLAVSAVAAGGWFQARYEDEPEQTVPTRAFGNREYPEDPEARSRLFGYYPHRELTIHRIGGTRFRFLLSPASDHATTIELGVD